MLEPLALVSLDQDLGVQREAVEVAAQLAGHEDPLELAAAAEAGDGAAASGTQGDAALDRGGAELREQGLVGLAVGRAVALFVARQVAVALQVARDASVQGAGELLDLLVLERGGRMEDGSGEGARTGEDLRQRVADDFGILEQLLEARPGAAVYFQDSVFPATRLVRERLLPLLRDAGRPWGCQVYLPMLSRKFARLLADHGCTYVYTGVESGLQDLRTAVGKPGLRDSLIRERLNWLGEEGLRIGLSLMFGILGTDGQLLESEHSIELTVDLANQCLSDGLPVEAFFPNVLTVLPGTAVASALSSAGFPLDFYRMPRVPAFAGLEDGEVGYNFASLPGFAHEHDGLIQRVRKAASHVASLRRP